MSTFGKIAILAEKDEREGQHKNMYFGKPVSTIGKK